MNTSSDKTKEAKDLIAYIFCSGNAGSKGKSTSCESCNEAAKEKHNRGECKSGCLGIGSCIETCTRGAMKLVDDKIVIDEEKCDGCGDCAKDEVCPRHLIKMIPRDATNFIPCSSKEEDGDVVREVCGYGCIGCGECARLCPNNAVEIVDNHAIINYDKCEGCAICTVKCKKKIIVDKVNNLSELKEKVAFVRCSGGSKAHEKYEELGFTSCKEIVRNVYPRDYNLCTVGCTGTGDCTKVCRYDAIHIVNGTALVDPDKCVGCKDCVYACPRNLITIIPYKGTKLVPCASVSDYEEKAKVCDSGCIACEECVNNCPSGALYMDDMHACVDVELCEDCNMCMDMCPNNLIKEQIVPKDYDDKRKSLGL